MHKRRGYLTQRDWGKISPKNNTAVTETMMFAAGVINLSKNRGNA